MKLWVLSDMHADRGIGDIAAHAPDFDALVCAGDVVTGDVAMSIEMVAVIAGGKPSVFVAGNHEMMTAGEFRPYSDIFEDGHAAAAKHGVHFLELDTAEIGGIRFAGATLWTPLDARHAVSVRFLQAAHADIIVTHFPPSNQTLQTCLPAGGTWICGHHHGSESSTIDGRKLVRNAIGYGAAEDLVDSEPARHDFTVEI